jgi:multimeric flavodoxin WrbA
MTNIAVVFQSGKGHTRVLAEAILKGINGVGAASGHILEIRGHDVHEGRFANEALMAELDKSDGIVFGCATYMGSGSAIFKAFLEAAFTPHWLEQRWKDKIAVAFTNSASQSGDKLLTLLQLTVFAMQMGMIWVGDVDTAERFGGRVALITRRFKDGTTFRTERIREPHFREENIRRRQALSGRKG